MVSVRKFSVFFGISRIFENLTILERVAFVNSSCIFQFFDSFKEGDNILKKSINFSSATTCGMFQANIEADIEKRQGKTFAPPFGRRMVVFLDDISMPEVNTWGDQPTLEIVRQLVEYKGFYFLEKDKRGDRKTIELIDYVAAMSHPGGKSLSTFFLNI